MNTYTYNPFWNNMMYSEVAFLAKMITSTYASFNSVFDPENPPPPGTGGENGEGDTPPTLVITPYAKEIERGVSVNFSLHGSHTNPRGHHFILEFNTFTSQSIKDSQALGMTGDQLANYFDRGTFSIGGSQNVPPGVYKFHFKLTDTENSSNQSVEGEFSMIVKATHRCVYSVSEEGIAYVTFDTGDSWISYDIRVQKSIPGLKLRSVVADPYNRLMAWFGDDGGRVWRTETGLSNVSEFLYQFPGSIESIAINQYTANLLYIGCSDGKAYKLPAHGYPNRSTAPSVMKDIGVPISVIASHPLNPNCLAIGGQNVLWVSSDNGNIWNQISGFNGDITDMQYSKSDPSILLMSTSLGAYSVDTLSRAVVANTETNGIYHPSISSMSEGPDSAIMSVLGVSHGNGQDWLFKSSPLGEVLGIRASGVTYPDNIQVEKTYDDRIWYSNASYLFRSYHIGLSYETGTYMVLQSSGTINDLDQGPLIGSNEVGIQFEVPILT